MPIGRGPGEYKIYICPYIMDCEYIIIFFVMYNTGGKKKSAR